jgi:hypothetical protein
MEDGGQNSEARSPPQVTCFARAFHDVKRLKRGPFAPRSRCDTRLSLFTTRSSFDLRFRFSVLSALIVLSRASSGGPGDVLMVTRWDRLA